MRYFNGEIIFTIFLTDLGGN